MKTWYCVASSFDDRGHVTAGITSVNEQDEKPEDSFKSTLRKDIYCTWFESLEEAKAYVRDALAENGD